LGGLKLNTIDYVELGKKIKENREKKKMTQEQLAESVNLSPTHISNIETAHTKVSLSSLVMIANMLKVSADELLYDSLIYPGNARTLGDINEYSDCSSEEMAIINDVTKALRSALKKRKQNRK
jgi:transcriptional regulator with XRE-family HTH domain